MFYIPTVFLLPSPPLIPSLQLPSPHLQSTHPLFLLRKGQTSHEYQQNMAYQVAARLSISPVFKLGKAIQFKHQGQSLLPFLGVQQVNQAIQLSHECRGSLVVGSDFVSSYETRLVVSGGFLVMSLTPLAATILLPFLQQDSSSLG